MKLKESNKIEFKQTWQDKYLSTICAFANTEGGTLYIGFKDDGSILGVSNPKKLLEDLPNKIVSKLGIIAKVTSETKNEKDIIAISTSKLDVPISYNGRYYVRTGTTTQELNGKELTRFIISNSLNNWDESPVPESTISEIDLQTLNKFKVLSKARLSFINDDIRPEDLLLKLNLMKGKYVKRAGLLLFGKNVKKFFTSAFIRIGKFNFNNELLSSDTIEGNLFEQIENCIEILKKKYLLINTKIDGLYRQDTLEFPEPVLREAIINAVVHRDYIGAHIQIKIYPDKIIIWSEGTLPPPLKIEDLKIIHPSRPRNELIADIFFKAGLIETWGHGTLKMISVCKEVGLQEPVYAEEFGGFSVRLTKDILDSDIVTKFDLNDRQINGLKYMKEKGAISNKIYQEVNHVSKGTATKELMHLVKLELLKKIGTRGAGSSYQLRK
jgi:ATP-dependent DNA helicase RecG